MKTIEIWIAKDKDNSLWLFDSKPTKKCDLFFDNEEAKSFEITNTFVGATLSSELTFDNSPRKLKITLK